MFEVGDVVTITVPTPDGIEEDVLGKVGVVIRKDIRKDKIVDLTVKYGNERDYYVFGDDQVRYATNDEVLSAFRKLMMR